MSSVIQNLLRQALGDAARSTKFECVINFNEGIASNEDSRDAKYHVKTSQFPGKSNEVIDFKFKGRTIPIKGQVKYDNTWTCVFYLAEDHSLKTKFENWIESLEHVHNFINEGQRLHSSVNKAKGRKEYVTEMKIEQKDFHGENTTAIYTLYNVFPKSVSSVDADYTAVGSIQEFTVEFSYSHFSVETLTSEGETSLESIVNEKKSEITEVVTEIKSNIGRAGAEIIRTAEDMLHKL